MTRIISGSARGRRLAVPSGDTRPTTDRAREGLFSILGNYIADWPDEVVLDAFAGSGALGLEAASRGARQVLLVERARPALRVLQTNADRVGADSVRTVARNAWSLGQSGRGGQSGQEGQSGREKFGDGFTLIFCDPPYREPDERIAQWLAALAECGLMRPDALVVVERSARGQEFDWPGFMCPLTQRRYSDSVVCLARYADEQKGGREGSA